MKNSFYHSFRRKCLTLLVLLTITFVVDAQQRNLKTEVLAYIMPDSLELPANVKSSESLDSVSVKSASLLAALTGINIIRIAKAFPDWPAKDSLVIRDDGMEVLMPPFHRIFILTFSTESEADASIPALTKSPAVLFAEKHSQPVLDNDPSYIDGTQWHLNNDGRNGGVAGADINAEGAWAIFTGSPNITIAIIDSGVDTEHEDLTGKATGESPLGNSHGTRVAGVAAARAFNLLGIRGIDWEAQILSKRISDMYDQYLGDAEVGQKITDAINEGAAVVNSSWSFLDYSTPWAWLLPMCTR
jgi:subtilisin family serine protease